ncbi:hypothetical protein LUZ63_001686 [Rhynchospora breviuscula]|uniref:WRC domain-containing protein n=1 Tax=Rhynchospora breviuscula TaxID=2022672 RepID=A0A9Q0HXA0_9POAL|nr:hypothetical protein LUZ63_001686 [Rhynchospora breviuscula]
MRIRKTVSKLLGSAIVYPSSHHSPPPSDLWAPLPIDASGLVCELNQSPWDVYPNLHLFNNNFQGWKPSAISKKEDAQEERKDTKEETKEVILENTGGILENSTNSIQLCEKPASSSSKKTDKKKKKKKKKEKEMKDEIILCKKNDGKKWYCKRQAQSPHSLCEYHLSQSRSYYNNNKEKEACQFDVPCKPIKRKHKPRENGDSDLSPFYYYNGFGPSSRKRRGCRKGGIGDKAMHVADEVKLHGGNAAVADVDEEDDEEVAGVLVSSSNGEEKQVPRKRGRKPVKCRSLKSLL